jgi:hypothetical protein
MGISNGDFVWLQVDSDNNLSALASTHPIAGQFSYSGYDGNAQTHARATEPRVNDIITIGHDGSSLVGIKIDNATPGDFWQLKATLGISDNHNIEVESFSKSHNEYIKYKCLTYDDSAAAGMIDCSQFNDDKLWVWGNFGYDGVDGSTKYYNWSGSQWDGTVIDWDTPLPANAWSMILKWDGRYGTKDAVTRDWWIPNSKPGGEDATWVFDGPNVAYDVHVDKNIGQDGLALMWVNLPISIDGTGSKNRSYTAILERLAQNKWKYRNIFEVGNWTEPVATKYILNIQNAALWKGNAYSLFQLSYAITNPLAWALYKEDGSVFDWTISDGQPDGFVPTEKYLWMPSSAKKKAWRYDGNVMEVFDTATMNSSGVMRYDSDTDELYYVIRDTTVGTNMNKLYKYQDDGTDDGTFKLQASPMTYDYTWTGKWSRTNPTAMNNIPNPTSNGLFSKNPMLYTGAAEDRAYIDNDGKSMIFFGIDFATASRVEQLKLFPGTSSYIANDGGNIFYSSSWSLTDNWSLNTSCDSIGDVFLNVTNDGTDYTCSVYASTEDRDGTQNRVCHLAYTATGNTPIIDDDYDIDGTVNIKTLATDNNIIVSVPVVAWQAYPRTVATDVQGRYKRKFSNSQLDNPITFIMARTAHSRP